jgi:nucleobase:cation symporter-1, NCS1 family
MSAEVQSSTNTEPPASAEVPLTLAEPAPRILGLLDQLGLWGNLGVSLLGFTGAWVVLHPNGPDAPALSLVAALVAVAVGTLLGSAAVALSAIPGAQTGAPAMVLLRGLFGAGPSYLPTALNIVQMVGWGTFELVTIAAAVEELAPSVPHTLVVLVGGALTTVLALRPLGTLRLLRRYVTVAVVLSLVYLLVQLLRDGAPVVDAGGWSGFSIAVDSCVAVAVSWVPMAADYARHSRTPRAAALAVLAGYGTAQFACYGLGLLALVTVAADADHLFAAFLAVPLGSVAFAVLCLRELDQSFANVYSTTVSAQNLRPGWDRRPVSVVVGVLITVMALGLDIYGYASFLSLIGSVFVPMFAVLVVDWFGFDGRRTWDLSASARPRWAMFAPWAAGFVMYQLIYPGDVGWWADAWGSVASTIGFTAQAWMSASLFSFAVAALATVLVHAVARALGRRA